MYLYFSPKSLIHEHLTIPDLPIPMNNESDDFIDDLNDFIDDFKYALDAWIREDYKTAYKVLLPLAEQEDAGAQFLMGLMYSSGLGLS